MSTVPTLYGGLWRRDGIGYDQEMDLVSFACFHLTTDGTGAPTEDVRNAAVCTKNRDGRISVWLRWRLIQVPTRDALPSSDCVHQGSAED